MWQNYTQVYHSQAAENQRKRKNNKNAQRKKIKDITVEQHKRIADFLPEMIKGRCWNGILSVSEK